MRNIFSVILILAGVILQCAFIKTEHDEQYVPAVILKGSASLMFVVLGFEACMALPSVDFAWKIFIGLVFGMIGDILLNLRFVFKNAGQKIFLAGIAAFLVGHILYLAALIPKASHLLLCALIGSVLAASLLTYIFKTMTAKKAFKVFGVIYLGAVIIMTVVAIGISIVSFPFVHSVCHWCRSVYRFRHSIDLQYVFKRKSEILSSHHQSFAVLCWSDPHCMFIAVDCVTFLSSANQSWDKPSYFSMLSGSFS